MSQRLHVEVGSGVCALPGESVCGDACEAFPFAGGMLLAVADGLGHGPSAAAAARAFMSCARELAAAPLDELFAQAHRALLRTRGAVAAVARFEEATGELSVAGLGNIGVLVVRAERRHVERPVLVPGVLGSSFRPVRPQTLALGMHDLVVMHTDGVRARLDGESFRGLSAQSAVDSVLRTHARRGDDAGCLVARAVPALDLAAPRALPSLRPPGQAEREIPIRARSDADCAAQEARLFAEAAGLGARAQWEVSIATSELATNIAKHAGHGSVRLSLEPGLLVLEAKDSGAGIHDVAAALADGYSEGGLRSERPRLPGEGLGVGLGSVQRMMDHVTVESDGARGTRIVAKKRLPPP